MNATATGSSTAPHQTAPAQDDAQTMGQRRAAFLDTQHFDDGEVVHKSIEWVPVGPISIPIPNPPSRVHALKLHDLHHIVTGYGTNLRGEWQISAWEVGAGLHRNPVAWTFCLMGHTAGMFISPRLTVRAYARGRRCRTLFDQDAERAFATTVADGKAFCGTDQPAPKASARDMAGAVGWGMLGIFTSLLPPLAWAISRFGKVPQTMLPEPSTSAPA